jgi:SAM-dependent methyltransferase
MRESTIGEPANTTCVLGQGQFADAESAGFEEELAEVEAVIAALPPGPVLDVACGTGFLTRHLRGSVVALDQSESMLAIARPRLPDATLVRGDALRLPFPDNSFDRVFTANFYGHLEGDDRLTFLTEARRVAPELVVLDAPMQPGIASAKIEERVLADGSRWHVFKRFHAGGTARRARRRRRALRRIVVSRRQVNREGRVRGLSDG